MSRLLRFEAPTMESARLQVRERLGTDLSQLRVVHHGRELTGGVLGFFQRERFVIEVADPCEGEEPAACETAPTAAERPGAQGALGMEPAPVPDRLAALLESTTDTVGVSFDQELIDVLNDAEAVVYDAANTGVRAGVPTGDAGCAPPATGSFPPRPAAFAAALVERLAAVGLAEQYLPDPRFSQVELALPLRLAGLPQVPPVPGEGGVAVLLGEPAYCLAVARQLVERLDDEAALLVCSHRHLCLPGEHARARTPQEAGEQVRQRRAEGLASVAIVDCCSRDGFVSRCAGAIRPERIWGVVPAAWGTRQVRALEGAVGHLDALALYDFLGAARPATLVGAGWPISYVDGWRASPLSLAARILEAAQVGSDA